MAPVTADGWAEIFMALMKCPKCGREYYGHGCPNCDYPPVPPDSAEARRALLMGPVVLATGIVIVLAATRDPQWRTLPVYTAAGMFMLAGLQLLAVPRLYAKDGRLSCIVGGLLLAAFAYLCFYGAFSPAAHWSALPFLPAVWSHALARTLSGLSGILCAGFSTWSFIRAARPRGKGG